MDKENEGGSDVEESLDLPEIPEGEEDTTDWKAEAEKLRQKAIAQRERTKTKNQRIAELEKAVGTVAASKTPAPASKTDELNEAQLDYLDLKGVSTQEDIKVIEDIVKKTGMTVRQALQDDYVKAKLTANKDQREVKEATPSASRRSGGGQANDLATALAKYEQSGFDPNTLPSDFDLQSQVINAVQAKTGNTRPAWES